MLEDVRVHGTVGTIRPGPAKLAIVVTVVAIGAENLNSHQTRCRAILIQHVGKQAGLRQRANSDMRYRMARGCGRAEFRNDVQGIRSRNESRGRVPVDQQSLLADTRAVTPQASLVLIDGRKQNGGPIIRANSGSVCLRGTNGGGSGKRDHLIGTMSAVAIHTSGMTIVIKHRRLGGVVKIGPRRQGVAYFGNLSHDIRSRRRQKRSALMTGHASLSRRIHIRGRRRCRP